MISYYIVRHGQTILNFLDKAQGWADSPLTDDGRQTAVGLGNKLAGISFDAVFTSDMLRAVETAELILQACGNTSIPIQKDTRLREWCLGSMEAEKNTVFMKNVSDWLGGVSSLAELNRRLPDVADAIYEHDKTKTAEPFSVIKERLKDVFTDIARDMGRKKDCRVLVVTHAFSIKTLFYLFAPEDLHKMDKIKNATVSLLQYDHGNFHMESDLPVNILR